jgi:hypothetical protein
MSTEGTGDTAEPMEEAPGMAKEGKEGDNDDDDESVIIDDGMVEEIEAGDIVDLDYIDLRASTLKSLMGNWCLHAHNHIKENPENVLRGWRDSGLLSAFESHTIGEAHFRHSRGLLWPKEGPKEGGAEEPDDGAFPLSRTDEIEQTERVLNRADDKVLEIQADGVVQASSGITYPLDRHGSDDLMGDEDAGFVEKMPAELFKVTAEMSITKKKGVKKASKSKKQKKAAEGMKGKSSMRSAAPTLPGADRIIGLHWTESDDDDVEMRLLHVGVDERGVFHGWALVQPPPPKCKLPKTFKDDARRMAWYNRWCEKYELVEVLANLKEKGFCPESGGLSEEEIGAIVDAISVPSEDHVAVLTVDSGDSESEEDGEDKEEKEGEKDEVGEEPPQQEHQQERHGQTQGRAAATTRTGRTIRPPNRNANPSVSVYVGGNMITSNINISVSTEEMRGGVKETKQSSS